MFFVSQFDRIANAARTELERSGFVVIGFGSIGSCLEDDLPIFASPTGTYKGTYLRHNLISRLRELDFTIPKWARKARYGIALKSDFSPSALACDPAFRDAILGIPLVYHLREISEKDKRPRTEWRNTRANRWRDSDPYFAHL